MIDALKTWDARAQQDRRAMALESLAIFAFFFFLHWLCFGGVPAWTDADAPYHHLLQAEIHEHGWWRDVVWLPHTILGPAGPDHHWLWHLLLSPFSAIDDLATRVDVVAAFSFALIPAFTNLAFRLLGIPGAPLWIFILMAGSDWTLFRWSMARAQNPACVLMILFIVALARRHKPSLLLIPFVFMHTYHGAALLAAPGAFFFTFDALRNRKADWWLLALPALGGTLALITSPWYPQNIPYFLFHTIDKVGNSLDLNVGMEWYGASLLGIAWGLKTQLAALVAMFVCAVPLWRKHQASPLLLTCFATLIVFIYFTWEHARFVEYCSQIVVLLAALLVRDFIPDIASRARLSLQLLIIPVCLLISVLSLHTLHDIRDKPTNRFHFNQDVGEFLTHFAKPGSLIANLQWDNFPSLVWHAPTLRYLSGLDPYYLAAGDEKRFFALQRINGDFFDPRKPSMDARTELGSDWVLTHSGKIAEYLARSGQASIVMQSDTRGFVIYVGIDPDMPRRIMKEGTRWLTVYWHRRPPAQNAGKAAQQGNNKKKKP